MLLNHGIELDSKDGFGNTALHYASGSGLTQIAKLLLDNGADVNAAGSQLLTYYFQYGIRFGELAQEGLTALDIALRRGLHETARLLCKYSALVTNFSKNLLLHDESLSRLVHLNNQETVKLDNLGDISFSTNISAKTLNTDSSASKIIFTEVVFKAIDAEPKLYELTFSSNQEAGKEFSKKIIVKAIASASDARQIAAFKFMEKKQSKYVEKKSSAFEGAQTHKKTGKGKPVRNDKIVLYGNPPIFKRAQKQRGCAMQRFLVSA